MSVWRICGKVFCHIVICFTSISISPNSIIALKSLILHAFLNTSSVMSASFINLLSKRLARLVPYNRGRLGVIHSPLSKMARFVKEVSVYSHSLLLLFHRRLLYLLPICLEPSGLCSYIHIRWNRCIIFVVT